MEPHEVMRDVLKETPAKRIAAEMGLSLSLVYKWAEPPTEESGSGASSPLGRVGQLIRISQHHHIVQWVCEQAGGFYISNAKIMKTGGNLIPMTNDIVKEFADMLATIAQAAGDNTITAEEARKIRQRWEDLKSVTEGFVHAAERGDFSGLKR
ncbi:MAG: hypothetical protein WC378_20375 [Opitutaceae bacterium]|jgi:hypothetical protein